MGIFSTNSRPGLANYTVEAAEGYGGPGAGYKIMVECHQNDMAMFNGLIQLDFNEAYAGINESSIITEGAIGNFFKKLKEFFLKLIEKIKGLVKSFMTKFVAMFVRDNKDLVKKYHKQVVKNLNDNKLKNMSFKAHENFLKGDFSVLANDKIPTSGVLTETYLEIYKYVQYKDFAEKCQKMKEDLFDNDKALEEALGCPLSDFKEEYMDLSLGSIDTFDEYTSSMNTIVEGLLTNGGKTIKTLQNIQKKAESTCRKNLSSIEKAQKEFDKLEKDKMAKLSGTVDGNKFESNAAFSKEDGTALTGLLYQAALVDQTVITTLMTTTIDLCKIQLKEARSVYIKAASFRGVKEDALMDFIDEASNYEVDMIFESPCKSEASDEEIENTINQDVADIADEECK